MVAPDLSCLLDPALDILEGLARGDIVADHGDLRVVDVGGNERSEALLAGRVPQLEPHHLVIDVQRLSQEVDADRCLP